MNGVVEWLNGLEPAVAAAVVAAVVSLLTTLLATLVGPYLKYGYDKRLENRKLEFVYQSEQRNALRNHIAHHKGRFLEAADSLSHRIWNYERNQDKDWLATRGQYSGDFRYYTKTFAYRFLLFVGTARLLEREAMYIDAKFATRSDFAFLKAIKLNIGVWTDTDLFKRVTYDSSEASDHFYRDELISMADSFFDESTAMTLAEFTAAVREEKHPYVDVFRFFDGLRAAEERHRHDRVITAHLVLIATLNSFGYSFQRTSEEKIGSVIDNVIEPGILEGLRDMVVRLDLQDDASFSGLLGVITSRHSLMGADQDQSFLKKSMMKLRKLARVASSSRA
jgi:hypothetical protein